VWLEPLLSISTCLLLAPLSFLQSLIFTDLFPMIVQ
jgi:hypothetical protein